MYDSPYQKVVINISSSNIEIININKNLLKRLSGSQLQFNKTQRDSFAVSN